MGYATPIRAPEQVEYRLAENCGCDQTKDPQFEYRVADAGDLRWIGSGLSEFGLTPGATVDADMARALMDGRDPNTNEQLVKRKKVLDPRGKVPAHIVVDAVRELAAADDMTVVEYLGNQRLAERFARAERGIKREGEHVIPVADAERLAAAAGLNADTLYGADVIAEATRWKGHHVDVGLRGVDVTAELVKSISVASGLVDAQTAAAMEEDFLDSIHEAVTEVLEPAAAYGMAGHHGDGERAARVESSGLIGWVTLHRSARPVDTASPGDPHLHAHINLAHIVHCADGKWRAPGAGGEEFHRYARLVNEVAEARFRAKLIEKYGARFELSDKGAWELVGIDKGVRTAFSRRHEQIVTLVGRDATREQQKAAARKSAEAKEDVGPEAPRENWRTRAAAHLGSEWDVDAMLAAALPGPDGSAPPLAAGGGPRMPSPQEIAAHIWDPEHGLTASKKSVSHVHVMAAVAAAVPYLLSTAQLTELTEQVLAVDGHAIRLPDSERAHYLHRQRYTHGEIVEAERINIEAASDGLNAGLAQLTAEAAEMTIATMELANSTPDRVFAYSAQQRDVILRLLTAGHAVDAAKGVAGAGKTTVMAAARAGWEAAGLRVAGTSTAAVAAANLAAEAGIDAQTIASWTREISGGNGLAGIGVLVIDEAAMVDDRALAVLLKHAAETGTKVVMVGDELQLRAVGVGGSFKRIHEIVDGLALTENRRQRDLVERAALQDWRDGARSTALAAFAEHGRVHAADTGTDALAAMLGQWNQARTRWAGDPHGQVADLLLLAARRTDVAALNAGARAVLVASGELEAGRTFATDGDGRLSFAVGDLVHIRRNDYRSRRDSSQPDVLNGFRGVVLDVTAHGAKEAVLVEWRRPGGQGTQQAWMSATDIAEGRLTHGYAITIGSAQGLTCDMTIAYGLHADSHSLYPAMSRARLESHLHLPLDELEDDVTRLRLGEARSDAERLNRAVAAYGKKLENDGDDVMVVDELERARAEHFGMETPEETAQRLAAWTFRAEAARAVPPQMQAHREAQEHGAQQTPTPEPGEGIDRARQLDEDQRARLQDYLAAGYASRPEPVPAPRREEAEPVPHWRDRPFGGLGSALLDAEIATAERKEAASRQSATALQREAEDLAALLGTDQSPGRLAVDGIAADLDAAEQHLAQAAALDKQATRFEAKVSALYDLNKEEMRAEQAINKRLKEHKLFNAVTFQKGRLEEDRDALRDRVEERTREEIPALRSQVTELKGQAAELRAKAKEEVARATGGNAVGPLSDRIADRRTELPDLYVRADRVDAEDQQHLLQRADKARTAAADHHTRLGALREERGIRTDKLTPDQNAVETVERTKRDAAARRAQQQKARENAERSAAAYHRSHDRHDGPSLGGGGINL